MHPNLKRELRAQLSQLSTHYNLSELTFESFLRAVGFKPAIAAADIAHAVSALLAAGDIDVMSRLGVSSTDAIHDDGTSNGRNGLSDGVDPYAATLSWKRDERMDISRWEVDVDEADATTHKFWQAYDALERYSTLCLTQ